MEKRETGVGGELVSRKPGRRSISESVSERRQSVRERLTYRDATHL